MDNTEGGRKLQSRENKQSEKRDTHTDTKTLTHSKTNQKTHKIQTRCFLFRTKTFENQIKPRIVGKANQIKEEEEVGKQTRKRDFLKEQECSRKKEENQH